MVNILVLVNVLTQGMCCAAALDTTGERVVPIKITQRHKKLHQAIHVELNNKFKNQTQETSQNNAPGMSLCMGRKIKLHLSTYTIVAKPLPPAHACTHCFTEYQGAGLSWLESQVARRGRTRRIVSVRQRPELPWNIAQQH